MIWSEIFLLIAFLVWLRDVKNKVKYTWTQTLVIALVLVAYAVLVRYV